ncbi:membrane hypothetical protein [Gammaproteobacteria bacterium]
MMVLRYKKCWQEKTHLKGNPNVKIQTDGGKQHSTDCAESVIDNDVHLNEKHADQEARRQKADQLINRNVLISVGCGLIPVPVIDAAGVAAIEITMISDLAEIYGFPFPTRLALIKLFISVVSSIGYIYIVVHSRSALKAIPLVGYLASVAMYSMANGIAVFAIGKVFQHHFESGGTLLSLDNTLIKDNKFIKRLYNVEYQHGKSVVPQLIANYTEMKQAATE